MCTVGDVRSWDSHLRLVKVLTAQAVGGCVRFGGGLEEEVGEAGGVCEQVANRDRDRRRTRLDVVLRCSRHVDLRMGYTQRSTVPASCTAQNKRRRTNRVVEVRNVLFHICKNKNPIICKSLVNHSLRSYLNIK